MKTKFLTTILVGVFFLSSCGETAKKEAEQQQESGKQEVISENKEGNNEQESYHEHGYDEEMDAEATANQLPDIPPKAVVYFGNIEDGADITSPVKIIFKVNNIEVAPAGKVIPGTGHHHVIIDHGPIEKGQVVPSDPNHIHYGQGQTETELELSPGEHLLTLQFADGVHRSYGPELSSSVRVIVRE